MYTSSPHGGEGLAQQDRKEVMISSGTIKNSGYSSRANIMQMDGEVGWIGTLSTRYCVGVDECKTIASTLVALFKGTAIPEVGLSCALYSSNYYICRSE